VKDKFGESHQEGWEDKKKKSPIKRNAKDIETGRRKTSTMHMENIMKGA